MPFDGALAWCYHVDYLVSCKLPWEISIQWTFTRIFVISKVRWKFFTPCMHLQSRIHKITHQFLRSSPVLQFLFFNFIFVVMQNHGIHSMPFLMSFKTRLLLITIKVLINTVQKLLSCLEFLISFSKHFNKFQSLM